MAERRRYIFLYGVLLKPQSAKAKGRRFQQEVAALIKARFALPDSDVRSLPMGSQGEDVWLSAAARLKFPFAIECKNVEKLNVNEAFKQALQHWEKGDEYGPVEYPLLVHTRNRGEVLATLRFDDLLELMKRVT